MKIPVIRNIHSTFSILFLTTLLSNCVNHQQDHPKIRQITFAPHGHTIHHNKIFSPDGEWIVFDGRNDDAGIGTTSEIGVVNFKTGGEKVIYKTRNPSQYGPGVGAASFSPVRNRVIFIHGLNNNNKEHPYGFSRRTGVAIDMNKPFELVYMDARDVTNPFTPGSLRGGTHAHCWSPDGEMISFTYNDELIEPELRTEGVMFPLEDEVKVDNHTDNMNGQMYAAIVADVIPHPQPGTDEINKAFDEDWVGKEGYTNPQGEKVPYAIAFQGNTIDSAGKSVIELFIAEIDKETILNDPESVGRVGERPRKPKALTVRRVTHTPNGFTQKTRFWLRSSPDGKHIYGLMEGKKGIVQLVSCDSNTGEVEFLTHMDYSITSPFNPNNKGDAITFLADGNIGIFSFNTGKTKMVTDNKDSEQKIVGAPIFSPNDQKIVFNQYRRDNNGGLWLQIMSVPVNNK